MKIGKIQLSRLIITGPIDLMTPLVVLKEIAMCHNIQVSEGNWGSLVYIYELIEKIMTTEIYVISESYGENMQMMKHIANFVNPKVKWTKETLIKAFNFLRCFMDKNELPVDDFEFGEQDPDHPYRLNACILYGLCRKYGIQVKHQTSLDEMGLSLKLYQRIREYDNRNLNSDWQTLRLKFMKMILDDEISDISYINLFLSVIPKDILSTNLDLPRKVLSEKYMFQYNIVYDILELWKESPNRLPVRPNNCHEAVALAAWNFRIDISICQNPMEEYNALIKKPYCPIDKELNRRLRMAEKNKYYINNPWLDQNFAVSFPIIIYEKDKLKEFCRQAGFSNIEIDNQSPMELLQESYLTENFYIGIQDFLISDSTFFMENVFDFPSYDCVCYGLANDNLRPYLFDELNEIFTRSRRYINTLTNTNYSDQAINKLKVMTERPVEPDEDPQSLQRRLQLNQTLNWLSVLNQVTSSNITNFLQYYENSSSLVQSNIKIVLTKLLESAMYMRGWDGKTDFPIKSHQTQIYENDEITMAFNITQSLIDFENSFLTLPTDCPNIKNLPLMIYRQNSFSISQYSSDGLTIGQRLDIVRNGVNGTIQACIRLSSNYLLSSVYYYLKYLNLDPLFDISNLDHIS